MVMEAEPLLLSCRGEGALSCLKLEQEHCSEQHAQAFREHARFVTSLVPIRKGEWLVVSLQGE